MITIIVFMLRSVMALLPIAGGRRVTVAVPLWERELLALCERAGESLDIDDAGQFTVLSWEKVLRALFALQSQCSALTDGSLSVRVESACGPETLLFSAAGGVTSVEPFTGPPALILSHLEALRFFLGPVSSRRGENALARAWFPLPLWLSGIDKV